MPALLLGVGAFIIKGGRQGVIMVLSGIECSRDGWGPGEAKIITFLVALFVMRCKFIRVSPYIIPFVFLPWADGPALTFPMRAGRNIGSMMAYSLVS